MLLSQRPTARGLARGQTAKPFNARPVPVQRVPRTTHIVRAAASEDDDDLEKRLAKLRQLKRGDRATKSKDVEQPKAPVVKEYNFSDEVLYYEGNPSRGDLAVNIALGTTLVWLPLTIAAVTRALYITYRITDKRITVTTSAPWKTESTTIPFEEIKDVVVVGRGLGFWGDMVLTLRNGDKVEVRSLEKFQEVRDYIVQRRDALRGPDFVDPMAEGDEPAAAKRPGTKGFA